MRSACIWRRSAGPRAGAADGGPRQIGLPLEERGDALARLLGGAPSPSSSSTREFSGTRSASRGAPPPARLAVGRELSLQVGDLGRPQADEDRQAELAGGGNVSSLVVAMRIGGCGFWNGVGQTIAFWIR